jgi:predicted HAD superfamily Cof-like phosphohydrolase
MATPLLTGNQINQNYIIERYSELRAAGYSKSQAHAMAFDELRAGMAQAREEQARAAAREAALANHDDTYDVIYSPYGPL